MPSKFTLYDLDTATDYLGFESFCNDLMSREGYRSIQPLGGNKDKGRDAIHLDRSTGIATVLSYSVRDDWENKLEEDLEKVKRHKHECQRFVFATSAHISPSAFDQLRDQIKNDYGWDFDLFARERIATLVDNQHRDLLTRHAGIFSLASEKSVNASHRQLDPRLYATYLLRQYAVWVEQYTPLLAEHKELDTFVDLHESAIGPRLPVADLPDASQVSLLLGESGAGKTTSLWKIAVKAAMRLRDGRSDKIPVLLNLREWSKDRRVFNLIQERFEPFELESATLQRDLRAGVFLLMADGINEVAQTVTSDCAHDLVNFIASYPENKYVVTCRSADFRPELLPTIDTKPPIHEPNVYEICRLDKDQVLDYSHAYGVRHGIAIQEFLERLRVQSDDAWESATSTLQLARIPLYLQIFLDVFRQTGELPNTRAELLRGLVDHILHREESRGQRRIDSFANERTLGFLAFQSTTSSLELRLQVSYAREIIQQALDLLRQGAFVGPDVTVGELWSHLLSANFLKPARANSVEWLHQLLRDYFLGTEFARIWRTGEHRVQLDPRLGNHSYDFACTIALSLLGEQHGDSFLLQIIHAYAENARRAFEGQTDGLRRSLLTSIVCHTLKDGDPETKLLRHLSRVLPYVEVVDALDQHFYHADENMKIVLIEAIAQLLVEHLPKINAGFEAFYGWHLDSSIRDARYKGTRAATRRAAEVLAKYLRNKDEFVSFHAAKGLYESDRPAAVQQLKRLAVSADTRIRSLVAELADDWGIS